MTTLTDTIAALDDATAVRVLAEVADYQAPLPDPAQLRAMETGLRQATATDPALTSYTDPGAPAGAGDLARATLQHLAARPDLATVITRAIQDSGHGPHLDQPAVFRTALAEHLAGTRQR